MVFILLRFLIIFSLTIIFVIVNDDNTVLQCYCYYKLKVSLLLGCNCRTSADDERLKRLNEHNALVKAGYNHTNVTIPEVPSYRNLWIYTFIVVSVFVLGLLRALFIFFTMLTSSRHLHNDMFASIVRSRMIFFDTNPIGESCVTH